jgi:ADP-ribose pyrophosphatase YjhB (NUDIX family)
MEIESSLINHNGSLLKVLYRDIDSATELEGRTVSGVHAYCFTQDKLVIVYSPQKGRWTPAGGAVEAGETPEEAVIREVHEETNMKVLKQAFLGYQDIVEPDGKMVTQTQSICIVEPYGNFVSDPDGDIAEIKLIYPAEYKKYFDWGIIGDHVMERALKLKGVLEQ